jgi:Zinc carboxypeptidase
MENRISRLMNRQFSLESCLMISCVLVSSLTACGNLRTAKVEVSQSEGKPVYVRIPNVLLTKEWVQSTGFNRDHAKNSEYAVGWLPNTVLNQLAFADRSEIHRLDELAVAEGRLNPFTLEASPTQFDAPVAAEGYHNYQAMTEELRRLADSHSDIAKLTSLGKSSQGRELWMMTISDQVDLDEGEPELLYIANMHGDEVVGRELSIYHIRSLLDNYSVDLRTKQLVNNSKMFIVPSMNPDGFELRQRNSAVNTDLNRNFPDFTSDNRDTSTGRAIETKAIMDLHAAHHFVAAVNFHGGEVCFNLPWDTKGNDSPTEKFADDAVLNPMGRAWADSNPTMAANSSFDRGLTYGYEWYEVNGGMQDWAIWYRKSMHATVELSYVKWPDASYLSTAWLENKEAMFSYHERALFGIHLEVVDDHGDLVPNFEVRIESSARTLSYSLGHAHRPTTAGKQKANIIIGGRAVNSITVNARMFDGKYDRVTVSR